MCDSGAESSLIKYSTAKRLGLEIHPTIHSANQADGHTKMKTCGEAFSTLTRNDVSLTMEAIVMQDLGCDIIGGAPFMEKNGIVLDMPNRSIIIQGRHSIKYSAHYPRKPPLSVRRSESFLLKSHTKQVILPGDFVEVPKPEGLKDNTIIAIEPRCDTGDSDWIEPMISECINGTLRLPNLTTSAVSISKHQHLAQIHYTMTASDKHINIPVDTQPITPSSKRHNLPHSHTITIDPNHQLSRTERLAFANLHERFDQVFNSRIGRYNDASGPIRACINMGLVPVPTGLLPLLIL